ncbi:malate dehydrogenase, chloroplastic [Tanacetum coccineum]
MVLKAASCLKFIHLYDTVCKITGYKTAATSASTLSIGPMFYISKASSLTKSKAPGVNCNSRTFLKNFSGLKASLTPKAFQVQATFKVVVLGAAGAIVAEVLKQKGAYNPKKLFGVTTLDVVRANTFVAQKKNLNLIIKGHAGIAILPLLSKTKPLVNFTDEEITRSNTINGM